MRDQYRAFKRWKRYYFSKKVVSDRFNNRWDLKMKKDLIMPWGERLMERIKEDIGTGRTKPMLIDGAINSELLEGG